MSQRDRDIVAEEIIRIAQARYRFGFEPFFPVEPSTDADFGYLPIPFLSDAEVIALHELFEATAKWEKWPESASEGPSCRFPSR